jgi:hypothetical protein
MGRPHLSRQRSGGYPDEMHRVSSVPPAVLATPLNGAGTASLFQDEYVPPFGEIGLIES